MLQRNLGPLAPSVTEQATPERVGVSSISEGIISRRPADAFTLVGNEYVRESSENHAANTQRLVREFLEYCGIGQQEGHDLERMKKAFMVSLQIDYYNGKVTQNTFHAVVEMLKVLIPAGKVQEKGAITCETTIPQVEERFQVTHSLKPKDEVINQFETMLRVMRKKDERSFLQLLHCNPELVHVSRFEGTLLHYAAAFAPEFIPILIKHGANVNAARAHDGETPLHLAALHRQLESISFLFKAGAKDGITNNRALVPLVYAVKDLDTTKRFFDLGVSIHKRYTDYDKTALHLCTVEEAEHNPDVFSYLLAKGCDINAREFSIGEHAFMGGVKRFPQLFPQMMAAGANLRLKDRQGNDVVSWAIAGNNIDLVETLFKMGVYINAPQIKFVAKEYRSQKLFTHKDRLEALINEYLPIQEQRLTEEWEASWQYRLLNSPVTWATAILTPLTVASGYFIKRTFQRYRESEKQSKSDVLLLNELTKQVLVGAWQVLDSAAKMYAIDYRVVPQAGVSSEEILAIIKRIMEKRIGRIEITPTRMVLTLPPQQPLSMIEAIQQSMMKAIHDLNAEKIAKVVAQENELKDQVEQLSKLVKQNRERCQDTQQDARTVLNDERFKLFFENEAGQKFKVKLISQLNVAQSCLVDLERINLSGLQSQQKELGASIKNMGVMMEALLQLKKDIAAEVKKTNAAYEEYRIKQILTAKPAEHLVEQTPVVATPGIKPAPAPTLAMPPAPQEEIAQKEVPASISAKNKTPVKGDDRHLQHTGQMITPPTSLPSYENQSAVMFRRSEVKPASYNQEKFSLNAALFEALQLNAMLMDLGKTADPTAELEGLLYGMLRVLELLRAVTRNQVNDAGMRCYMAAHRGLLVHRVTLQAGEKINSHDIVVAAKSIRDLALPALLEMTSTKQTNSMVIMATTKDLIRKLKLESLMLFSQAYVAKPYSAEENIRQINAAAQRISELMADISDAKQLGRQAYKVAAMKLLVVRIAEYYNELSAHRTTLDALAGLDCLLPVSTLSACQRQRNLICHHTEATKEGGYTDITVQALYRLAMQITSTKMTALEVTVNDDLAFYQQQYDCLLGLTRDKYKADCTHTKSAPEFIFWLQRAGHQEDAALLIQARTEVFMAVASQQQATALTPPTSVTP